jgi:hypothetical protein
MAHFFKELNLSKNFISHFEGLMLGDGHLTNVRKSKHSASLQVKNMNLDYIEYLGKLFESEGIEFKIQEAYRGNFPGSKESYMIETKFYPVFRQLEQEWYENDEEGSRRKTIPNDFVLTPNTMLQWFIGDGYVVNLKGKPVRVMFCTDRYNAIEIRELQYWLLRGWDIETRVADRNRLAIRQSMFDKFYDALPKCPVESFLYKWNPVRDIV